MIKAALGCILYLILLSYCFYYDIRLGFIIVLMTSISIIIDLIIDIIKNKRILKMQKEETKIKQLIKENEMLKEIIKDLAVTVTSWRFDKDKKEIDYKKLYKAIKEVFNESEANRLMNPCKTPLNSL